MNIAEDAGVVTSFIIHHAEEARYAKNAGNQEIKRGQEENEKRNKKESVDK